MSIRGAAQRPKASLDVASILIASVLSSALAVAALAQPASPPAAKGPPSTTVAPVTVTGRSEPRVIVTQAHAFVRSYAAAANPELGQIGRWHDPVCVQVEGLAHADQAAMIKARIESVAQAVGLRAARAGCKANVEIVFTDQPQLTMDIVARRREDLLGYDHRREHDRLKTVTHPIQAWYKTATRGDMADNFGLTFAASYQVLGQVVIPAYNSASFAGQTTQNETVDEPQNWPPAGCSNAPRFTACLTSKFKNVFIVADSKAMQGNGLGVVADDLVMLALSQPKSLDGCSTLPSVIDLFAKSACPGRSAPDGLTPADAAYLTALYDSNAEANKAGEQADIAGRMAKILIKANFGGG